MFSTHIYIYLSNLQSTSGVSPSKVLKQLMEVNDKYKQPMMLMTASKKKEENAHNVLEQKESYCTTR
jgi:hypothetical protein